MEDFTQKVCKACEGGVPPLDKRKVNEYMKQIPKWQAKNNKFLKRKFNFSNFKESLDFVNKIGKLAENEGHHPDLKLGWGYVDVELTTHAVKGLSENDFIIAAKIDRL